MKSSYITHMVPLAWRFLTSDIGRFLITIAGVAFAAALILFLFATAVGVRDEANGYVAGRQVDVWVGQKGATNLFRSYSFMQSSIQGQLEQLSEVADVSPLLRLVVTTNLNNRDVPLFIFGFDERSSTTWPRIVYGTKTLKPGEIILDQSFARKYRLRIGDSLNIQDRDYEIVSFSRGTNALLVQFGFVTMLDAQGMLNLNRELFSFFLLTGTANDPQALADIVTARFPSLGVFTQDQFNDNNLEELRAGVLPILGSISFSGAFLALAILSLMLYSNVMEKREDYALLKALGTEQRFLVSLVLRQAMLAAGMGFLAGLVLYLSGMPLLLYWVPEMAQKLTWQIAVAVLGTILIMALLAAWLPIARLRYVDPAGVFRA